MIVFRIAKQEFVHDLSGTGARLYGGRWNSKGSSMLYTSENRALAMLETMVHTPQRFIPKDLWIAKIFIPDSAPGLTMNEDEMPEGWNEYPAPEFLAKNGDKFLADRK